MDKKEAETRMASLMANCIEADNALECLVNDLNAIPDITGLCKPRLVLLTSPDCQPCDNARNEYFAELGAGEIKEIDITSTEGQLIASNNSLRATPSLLLLDCENKLLGELFHDDEVQPVA